MNEKFKDVSKEELLDCYKETSKFVKFLEDELIKIKSEDDK